MARKRKQGVFEALIGIAALLPWWIGVLLALITYFVLHHFATAIVATPMTPGHIGTAVVYQFGKVLALYGQYLVPLAFLIGAGSSVYGRHKRAALFAGVSKDSSPSALNSMTWPQEAKSFAEGRNIDLIDGSELTAMIKKIQQQPQSNIAAAQPVRQSRLGGSCRPDLPEMRQCHDQADSQARQQ